MTVDSVDCNEIYRVCIACHIGREKGMHETVKEGFGQTSQTIEQARQLFERARRFYNARAYRKAIILFEQARHTPGVPRLEALLYNIGMANLRLRRFATAIIYFENYLASSAISQEDRRTLNGGSMKLKGELVSR
jgi:tetratricopeptide (TPR) repeat protein